MSIKLIALDVDGTLLTDQRTIQTSSVEAIKEAKNAGIKVVITTGRPLVSTVPLLEKLNLNGKDSQYIINLHGAIVQTTKGGILTDLPISKHEVMKVIDYISAFPKIDLMVQTRDQIYVVKHDLNWYTSFESFKNHLPIHFRKISDLNEEKLTFYKMMFAGDEEQLNKLTSKLPQWIYDELKTMRSEKCYIDMVNKKVDKGEAVESLANSLNIKPDEIMAIGDGNSDIPMLKYAKYGIAVKNATPDLLKVAFDVTTDNNHDGVANAIKKYI